MTEPVKKKTASDEEGKCAELQAAVSDILGISLEDAPLEDLLDRALGRIAAISWLELEPKGGIWLLNEAAGELELKAHRGLSEARQRSHARMPPGRCMCGKAFLTKKPVYASDCADESGDEGDDEKTPHGHWSVPVLFRGKALGVITLYLKQGRARGANEAVFLTSIAGILAGVIERNNTQMLLRRRFVMEKALGSLSRLCISQSDGYLLAALEILGAAVGASRAYIFEICPKCASFDSALEWCAPGVPSIKEGFKRVEKSRMPMLIKTLEMGDAVVVNDAGALGADFGGEKEILASLGVRSMLAVPIRSGGWDLHGFVGFDNSGGRREWMDEDIHILKVASDIISQDYERRDKDRVIRHMAYHDPLTGLANRRLLADRLTQTLARGRWKGRFAAMILLDIDRFKNVNDAMGHDAGDRLLQEVAERLTRSLRDGDTIARLGGDEFIIFLQEISRAEDVATVAKKIKAALEPPFVLGGDEMTVTASMGISIYPGDGERMEALIKSADIAMYQAKESGRNCWRFYNLSMQKKASELSVMEVRLRKAVEANEMFLLYQPQFDMKLGIVTGFEALVRWRDPLKGRVVMPDEFIRLAEETGVIHELGGWVLRTACAQNRQFNDRGHRLLASVNVSARQFERMDFIDTVEDVLKETGLDPHQLEIELTESIVMDNADEALSKMRSLREKGVRLAIDDFGTGFSSLSYLKRMPIDTLKIDRSFVSNITGNADDASIAIAIIRLAHSLNIKCVAEGVETEEQRLFLRRLECDRMQGYLFARPMTVEELEKMLGKAAAK